MYKKLYENILSILSISLLIFSSAEITAGNVNAEQLPEKIQEKVEAYKKKLTEWAADPLIIEAVRDSNRRGGITEMNNSKWDELNDDDPILMWLNLSAEGKLITHWEEDSVIDKLNVRDANANLVASSYISGKPRLYNNGGKPAFQNGLKGPWDANEIKPDLTTKRNAVQISVPVIDGGKVIGVLHSAVLAE